MHSKPNAGKNSHTPKKPFRKKFRYCETKEFSTKNPDAILMQKVIRYQEVSITAKTRPQELLHATKNTLELHLATSFYGLPRFLHRTSRLCQRLPETLETSWSTKWAPSVTFQYCNTVRQKISDNIWWYIPMVYRSFCTKQISSVNCDVFWVFISFRKKFFQKENGQCSCAVFLFSPNFLMSRYFVLQI